MLLINNISKTYKSPVPTQQCFRIANSYIIQKHLLTNSIGKPMELSDLLFPVLLLFQHFVSFIMCESSYCFQRILAIAILSVCLFIHLSICLSRLWISQKRCKLELPNFHCRLLGRLVSGTIKLFHKFEGGHPEQGR